MTKGLFARMSLLALSSAAVAYSAPLSLGQLTLNDVGSNIGSPDGYVEFRLTNWTGFMRSEISTPITFVNVKLTINWVSVAPSYITGPLSWYVDDAGDHDKWIQSGELAPNTKSYESTRFKRLYAMQGGTLTMELSPASNWSLRSGGTYTPPSSTYELVFSFDTPYGGSDGVNSDQALPSWDLLLADNSVPEPSTYLMAGLGAMAILAGQIYRRRT